MIPTGAEIVASYNWSTRSERGHPHIIVPGAPRKFVMSRGRFDLARDGVSHVDENRGRMKPFSAVEPLFHALDICSPALGMHSPDSTIDIVTDRNNLRNLLKFCRSPGDTWVGPLYFACESCSFRRIQKIYSGV